MNVDIEKVEKYILYGASETEILNVNYNYTKGKLRSRGVGHCILAVLLLLFATTFLPRIENMIFYYFILIVPIVLLTIIWTIKRCAKAVDTVYEDMKKTETRKPLYKALFWVIVCVSMIALYILPQDLRQLTNTTSALIAFVFVLGSVFCVYLVCVSFYKIHLMRKYTPYFKDKRLLPFTPAQPPAAPAEPEEPPL